MRRIVAFLITVTATCHSCDSGSTKTNIKNTTEGLSQVDSVSLPFTDHFAIDYPMSFDGKYDESLALDAVLLSREINIINILMQAYQGVVNKTCHDKTLTADKVTEVRASRGIVKRYLYQQDGERHTLASCIIGNNSAQRQIISQTFRSLVLPSDTQHPKMTIFEEFTGDDEEQDGHNSIAHWTFANC